jgi:MarR family transcriptional regulator for hemolysin
MSSDQAAYEDFWLLASQASRFWRKLLDKALIPHELTDASGRTLLCLLRSPEPLSQIELAELLGLDRSAVVRVLDILESRGLVERRDVVNDRRVKHIVLTPAGRLAAQRAVLVSQQLRQRIFADLPEDLIAATHEGLRRLCERLRREDP